MSEIQRYKLGGGSISEQDDGAYVLFTDHEAAIALRTRVCAEAFEDELARTEERVLADAKARIEGLTRIGMKPTYNRAIEDAIDLIENGPLTQPQTEIEGKPDGTWYDIPDGGGAANAAGVADADLVERVETLFAPEFLEIKTLCDDRVILTADWKGERVNVWMTNEQAEDVADILLRASAHPGPYAKAFRENVCPVPEFPGIEKEDA